MMQFLMILDDSEIAKFVCQHDEILPMVDLEYIGKAERQGHLNTWKSKQVATDVTRIREAVPDAHLVVRVNPIHPGSKAEIDDVIARGADSVMLPMFFETDELARFCDMLAGRAEALPLFETARSVQQLPEMVRQTGLRRLHIGLNDLHLDLGMSFLFEPLLSGILEEPAAAMRAAGVTFGIGGLARAGEGMVSPEYLLGEHVRLGSTAAILSRTFHRNPAFLHEMQQSMDFAKEIGMLNAIHDTFLQKSPAELEANRRITHDRIAEMVRTIKAKAGQP